MRAQTQESVFPREVAAVVEGGAIVAVEGEAVVVVDEWEGLGILCGSLSQLILVS